MKIVGYYPAFCYIKRQRQQHDSIINLEVAHVTNQCKKYEEDDFWSYGIDDNGSSSGHVCNRSK